MSAALHRSALVLLSSCRPDRATMVSLGVWTAIEAVPATLSGLAVAHAVDSFRAGDAGNAIRWLAALGLAIVAGALATRRLYLALAPAVEGTRDRLMAAVTTGSVAELASTGRPGPAPMTQLIDQVDQVRNLLSAVARSLRTTVAPLVAVVVGLTVLSPQLALAVMAPVAAAAVIYVALLAPMVHAQQAAARADEVLGSAATSTMEDPMVLRGLGADRWAVQQLHGAADQTARADRRLARLHAWRHVVIAVGGYLPLLTVLVVAEPLLREGRVTLGDVAGATTYVMTALLPALSASVTGAGGWVVQLLVLLDRLAAVANRPDPDLVVVPRAIAADPAFSMSGISFDYRRGARPVLDGLDVEVTAGQLVVIVGPSGAGKSTFAHLCAGLLHPTSGSLGVGAGRQLVLVPQTPYVFSGSVRENLCYLAANDVDEATIWRALEIVGLAGIVERLGGPDAAVPRGAAHDGHRLSDGECQRLVLARAWLSGADVLVVDEGWSRLDAVERERVEHQLRDSGRTLVVVTHHLDQAPRADLVMYFDGREVTTGRHRDLVATCSSYRELVAFAATAPGEGPA